MKLKDYISGKRHGKDANQLERESMEDPFLQDAIEGFDAIEEDHISAIDELEKRVKERSEKSGTIFYFRHWKMLGIAASITLLLGVGGWIFFRFNQPKPAVLAIDSSSEKYKTQTEETLQQELSTGEKRENTPLRYTPPVIMAYHDICADELREEEILLDEKIAENYNPSPVSPSASVAGEDRSDAKNVFDKKKSLVQGEVKMEKATKIVVEKEMANKSADKSNTRSQAEKQESFGEKEFKLYFEKNYTKGICSGKEISIEVEFSIDSLGTPKNIEVKKSTCEEVKKELIKLLSQGPKWTSVQRKAKMEIILKD